MSESSTLLIGSIGVIGSMVVAFSSYGLGLVWYVNNKNSLLIPSEISNSSATKQQTHLPIVITCSDPNQRAVMLAARCLGLNCVQMPTNEFILKMKSKIRRKREFEVIGNVSISCTTKSKSRRDASKKVRKLNGILVWNSEPNITSGIKVQSVPQPLPHSPPAILEKQQLVRKRSVSLSSPVHYLSDSHILLCSLFSILEPFLDTIYQDPIYSTAATYPQTNKSGIHTHDHSSVSISNSSSEYYYKNTIHEHLITNG